jgi:hypothetical protein
MSLHTSSHNVSNFRDNLIYALDIFPLFGGAILLEFCILHSSEVYGNVYPCLVLMLLHITSELLILLSSHHYG